MEFSEKIKKLREEKHLTQVATANLLEVPQRTYESWEMGTRTPAQYVQDSVIEKLGGNTEAEIFNRAAEFGKQLRGVITSMQLHQLRSCCEKHNREEFLNLFLEICVGNNILININAVQQIFNDLYEHTVMSGIIFGAISE